MVVVCGHRIGRFRVLRLLATVVCQDPGKPGVSPGSRLGCCLGNQNFCMQSSSPSQIMASLGQPSGWGACRAVAALSGRLPHIGDVTD